MTELPPNFNPVLALDIGSVNTRACLFDVVDGKFRFIGTGVSQTTANFPFEDAAPGILSALDRLQSNTNQNLITPEGNLIIPGSDISKSVSLYAATISAGPPLKLVLVGLQEDVSVKGLKRLAESIPSGVIETINLNDGRKDDERLSVILRLRPDLILVAGGTEQGASKVLLQLLQTVALACSLLPEQARPIILYAGNSALRSDVQSLLGDVSKLYFAANIRPSSDKENLDQALDQAAMLITRLRVSQMKGLDILSNASEKCLLTTPAAFGRIIRFLSQVHHLAKGVLGVDVSASATTLAAAFHGSLSLGVYPQLGLSQALKGLLDAIPPNQLLRWIGEPVPESLVRDYLLNKALNPGSLPSSPEELAIEQGVARCAMQQAVKRLFSGFSKKISTNLLFPGIEPIVAAGSVLTCSGNLSQTLLMLLDGLQPIGITTLILDQNHIVSALGAIAAENPALSVQVLESTAFQHLGTVVSPVGQAKFGTPILRVKITYEDDHEENLEIKQGALNIVPLAFGQAARLHLQPLQRTNVGMGGPGISGTLRVVGGVFGVVIDARGRPLSVPDDPYRGQELFRSWLLALGG